MTPKRLPKSLTYDEKWLLKSIPNRWEIEVASQLRFEAPQGAQGERRKPKLGTFGRHLGDLKSHYGTSWVQWEIPKSLILISSRKKYLKSNPKWSARKKRCLFIAILIEKCEVWEGLNPPKCFIYKHLGGFRRLLRNHIF